MGKNRADVPLAYDVATLGEGAGHETLDDGRQLGVLGLERVIDQQREARVVDAHRRAAHAQALAGEAVGEDRADVLRAVDDARDAHRIVDRVARA